MKLTQQGLQALLDYDPLTGVLTWKTRTEITMPNASRRKAFNATHAGNVAFTADDGSGYKIGGINGTVIRAHRVIFLMVHGYEPDFIDHDDHDRSNNRLNNLKDVTFGQNRRNQSKLSHNTSGVTGVCWDNARQKWMATISVGNKNKFLGRFDSKEKAIQARTNAEILYDYHPSHGK